MKRENQSARVAARITQTLHDSLSAIAQEKGELLSDTVRDVLEAFVERYNKEKKQ